MTSTLLDFRKTKSLQPAYQLSMQYQPEKARYAFRSKDLAEARIWQEETRQALARTIGIYAARTPIRFEKIEEVDKGWYLREKFLLRTGEHSLMPVYILLPKNTSTPPPVVLAFHGHGYGVKDIVGLWEDGRERQTPDGYHKDFAIALCREGFAVAAPEIACFGERQSDFSYLKIGQEAPTSCTHAAMLAFYLGMTVVGMRLSDARCLIEYLTTRKDLDSGRLGVMGISGGGMLAFFLTCLDARIRAAVISGYYSTFRDSIFAMSHCACNYIPGLGQFGEMYDLVGLIAPRPMMVEAGTYDMIFPISAVRKSVRRAREVYEALGARQNIETDYFEGRHQISGRKAYEFLKKKLDNGIETISPLELPA